MLINRHQGRIQPNQTHCSRQMVFNDQTLIRGESLGLIQTWSICGFSLKATIAQCSFQHSWKPLCSLTTVLLCQKCLHDTCIVTKTTWSWPAGLDKHNEEPRGQKWTAGPNWPPSPLGFFIHFVCTYNLQVPNRYRYRYNEHNRLDMVASVDFSWSLRDQPILLLGLGLYIISIYTIRWKNVNVCMKCS